MIRYDGFDIFTSLEMIEIDASIRAAMAEVERLEKIARDSSAYPGWFFPTDEQRTAQAARATLNAILGVRAGVEQAADYDHETALQIVSNANQLAQHGMIERAIIGQTVGDKAPSLESVLKTIKWVAIGGGALWVLTVFAPEIKMGVRGVRTVATRRKGK